MKKGVNLENMRKEAARELLDTIYLLEIIISNIN